MKTNAGFTLIEILVVLAIMGFLLAQLAPRLGGITDDARDAVSETNTMRVVSYMRIYFEQTSRFPEHLTNIVVQNGTTYQLPTISDQNPQTGADTLSKSLDDRNKLHLHIISGTEAAEMRKMGVVNILNLNSYDSSTISDGDRRPTMNPVLLTAGMGVAMVGIGNSNPTSPAWTEATEENNWASPELIGRIILGIGPESGLVTSGLVANAAHCPGNIRNIDNVTYNHYNVVLPRLKATVRLTDYPVCQHYQSCAV